MNFTVASFSVPAWVYSTVIGCGLLAAAGIAAHNHGGKPHDHTRGPEQIRCPFIVWDATSRPSPDEPERSHHALHPCRTQCLPPQRPPPACARDACGGGGIFMTDLNACEGWRSIAESSRPPRARRRFAPERAGRDAADCSRPRPGPWHRQVGNSPITFLLTGSARLRIMIVLIASTLTGAATRQRRRTRGTSGELAR
jgi:hypothetical protein